MPGSTERRDACGVSACAMQPDPKARTRALGSRDGVLRERAASALFVSESGRYLLQLRDNRPDISQPGCWAFFGGSIEGDETPQAALRRELWEELRFEPSAAEYFSEISIAYPPARRACTASCISWSRSAKRIRRAWCCARAARCAFSPEELELTPRVDPLGLAVLSRMRARPISTDRDPRHRFYLPWSSFSPPDFGTRVPPARFAEGSPLET